MLAANTIILDIVSNADYPQDLVEATLSNPDPSSNLAVISLAPLSLRKIAYVTAQDRQLNSISPRQALDCVGKQVVGCYYRSGNNLIVHAYGPFETIRLGYYQLPLAVSETVAPITHWLIDEYPALMLNGVIASTFQATGDDTSAAYYQRQYLQLRSQVRRQDLGED